MIKINDVEILTVLDGMTWSGSKDSAVRNLNFKFLYNPLKTDVPKYQVKCGDKIVWLENEKVLFQGYIEKIKYDTDEDIIEVSCIDLMSHLKRSKFVGRFKGTINEIANNICGAFGLNNGINIDNSRIFNIVSTGDITYYDALFKVCKRVFGEKKYFNLYFDGAILKLAEHNIQNIFVIGLNIRKSVFEQDISKMVNNVITINNDVIRNVENTDNINNYGLFQEVYNFNKDSIEDIENVHKMLDEAIKNTAQITTDNDNNCISGRFITVYEPVNGYENLFEIQKDRHIIGIDSYMELEIREVKKENL